jgi:hypothetical protein
LIIESAHLPMGFEKRSTNYETLDAYNKTYETLMHLITLLFQFNYSFMLAPPKTFAQDHVHVKAC